MYMYVCMYGLLARRFIKLVGRCQFAQCPTPNETLATKFCIDNIHVEKVNDCIPVVWVLEYFLYQFLRSHDTYGQRNSSQRLY